MISIVFNVHRQFDYIVILNGLVKPPARVVCCKIIATHSWGFTTHHFVRLKNHRVQEYDEHMGAVNTVTICEDGKRWVSQIGNRH